jgi:hypothetical protein
MEHGPQIGISREPWDVKTSSAVMVLRTRAEGNCPPLFFANTVKSATLAFNADARGPLPLDLAQ